MSTVPIAITGMHRSGTSMITRALHDSGLHLIGQGAEELIDAAEDNPEGFWENKAVVACNDELLEATGGSWDNPPELPPTAVDDPRVASLADQCTSALTALSEHEPWGFKDPRTCLTAGYWLDLQPDLRFIVCLRHPLEVALSLKRRNQNSYSLGLALWERYYTSVLDLVPPERRVITHYDTFFVDPVGEVERLCAFAGLDAAAPRVRSDLRHHTIGVSLADAGVNPSVRTLYARLCREAGAAGPPEGPSDEGRVRRLILDGAVAQRHADQRQAAIDRLEEREQELRAQHLGAEDELRSRVRELEQELRQQRASMEAEHRARVQQLEKRLLDTQQNATRQLEALQRSTTESINELTGSMGRTEALVGDIDGRTRTTAARLEVAIRHAEPGPVEVIARRWAGRLVRAGRRFVLRPGRKAVTEGRRVATPAARTAVHQLPPPARSAVQRTGRVYRRAVVAPGPTARTARRKLTAAAEAQSRRLSPTAQQALQRARRRVDAVVSDPRTTARAVAARLPEPASNRLRAVWRSTQQARSVQAVERSAQREAPAPAPIPKGPAIRHWRDAYEQMVRSAWSGDEPWLAVVPGSTREVVAARTPRGTAFPAVDGGRPLPDDLAHIAHLEALRTAGSDHLVVPEGSRAWLLQRAAFRDHLTRSYRTVVDEAGAGSVFDLTNPPGPDARSLLDEVRRLSLGLDDPPAVLDWTTAGLGEDLPGTATFRPPYGDDLPYLDASVDIVVIDRPERQVEAARVATLGVITVEPSASGASVVEVSAATEDSGSVPRLRRLIVWSSPDGPERWAAHLAERVETARAELHRAPLEAAQRPDVGADDVLIMIEPGVLPLPGAIEAAVALAATHPGSAITGKVLDDAGRLESAGGIVFADRSVGLVGARSSDVRAPWHEYRRPVCWAAGVIVASGHLWTSVPLPEVLVGRPLVREWCAALWATGRSVLYAPSVTAVRVAGDGSEPSSPLLDSAWQRVLDLRPARPPQLSDGAWRHVLAHDDVEACRG